MKVKKPKQCEVL